MEPEEKFMGARCRLMIREPWYGQMAMSIEWRPSQINWSSPEKATLGIKITNRGIVCFYNPEWVANVSLERLYGAVEHVINHLVHLHTLRQSSRDPKIWGIATDMTVNGTASNPRVGYKEPDSTLTLPFPDMIFIPDGWPENENAEYYYDRIISEAGKDGNGPGDAQGQGQGKGGQGQGQGKGKGSQSQGQGKNAGNQKYRGDGDKGGYESDNRYDHGQFGGQAVDDHGVWSDSDVSEDEARQMINERVKEATEKSQGSAPGHLKEVLDKLKKPIVRWREEVRIYLGTHVGNRRKTWSRLERKTQQFGTKGISRHAAATATIIVDTSGSIGEKELEQFFAEIESISSHCKIKVLLWDAAFQGFKKYRKGDWKSFEIRGGGGTDMSEPVKWLVENKEIADVTIMLTDGHCNWPPPFPFPMLFVITTPETSTASPEWGKVIRMKLD